MAYFLAGLLLLFGALWVVLRLDPARTVRRLGFLLAFGLIGAGALVSRTGLWVLGAPLIRAGMMRWQRVRAAARAPASGAVTREEACRILGVAPDSREEDIRRAHRRLIRVLHSDRDGSDWIAAKVNEARDVLLNRRGVK